MQENKLPEDADAQEEGIPTGSTSLKSSSKSWKKALVAFVVLAILGVIFYTIDLNRFFKGILVNPVPQEAQQEPLVDCDDDGLVSYWPMDEGFGNIIHDVVGTNDGTIFGEYEWVENADGSVALKINDGYISFGNGESLNAGMEDLSLVARLKTLDQASTVFAKLEPGKNVGYYYAMRAYSIVDEGSSPGTSLFWFKDGGTETAGVGGEESYACSLDAAPAGYTCGYGAQYIYLKDTVARVNDGEWHVVTGTLNRQEAGGGLINSYVDGQKASHTNFRYEPQFSLDNEGEFRVGAPQSPNYNYEGLISDLAVYKKELSQEEIGVVHSLPRTSKLCSYTDMYEPQTDIEAGLVSHLKFEKILPGNVVINEVEGVTYGSLNDANAEDGETLPEIVEGKIGNALHFDGGDDWVNAGGNPLQDGSLTMSAWIKTDGTQVGKAAYIMETSSTKYEMSYGSDNSIGIRTGYADEFCDAASLPNAIVPEQWTHVSTTYNHANGEEIVYINGEESGRTNTFDKPECQTIGGSDTFAIGAHQDDADKPFAGVIDETRVYSRALTAAEIKELYDYEVALSEGVEPGQIGVTTYHWDFNEGEGGIAHDSGGTQNDGMLFGDQGWIDGMNDEMTGGAFNFTNGYFRLEEPITINADQPFTLSAWVNLDDIQPGNIQYIMSSETSTGFTNGNWIFPTWWTQNKQVFGVNIMDGGEGGGTDKPAYHKYTYSNTGLEQNNWYNLIATYDGQDNANSIKLYVNGIEEGSYSIKGWNTGWTAIADKTTIGIRAGNLSTNRLLGSIDDLKLILGEAMDWAEVAAEYEAGPEVPEPEPEPIICTNKETEYEPGDTFDAGDDCNTCTCGEDGQISCTADSCEPDPVFCTYNDSEYEEGTIFDAGDNCNICVCGEDGQTSCTEAVCEIAPGEEGEGELDPDPVTCEYNSEDYEVGETFNSTDDCNICVCESDGGITCTNVTCNSAQEPEPDPDPAAAGSITINPNTDPINCLYESKTYSPGAAIHVDDCNTCFCGNNGQMSCTNKTCEEEAPAPAPTPTPGLVTSTPLPTTFPYCISGADKTTFVDLEEGEIKTSAEYLSQLLVDNVKVVGGYDTAFGHEYRPNKTITRAEFAKILLYLTRCDDVRQCNADYSQGPLSKIEVEDVDTASWYYNVVRCGLEEDIFYADTNDEFRPEVPITRAEATEMIIRAANIDASDEDGSAKFTDIQGDSYYNEFIGAASKMKIINGYSDSTFRPDNPISRGEAALILTRYLYQKSLTE